jgi:hypothetical protein
LIATGKRARAQHWKRALPFYLKVSLIPAGAIAFPILAIVLVRSIRLSFRVHRVSIWRFGLEYAVIFGGFFFLMTFIAAVGADIRRNWSSTEPTVAWSSAITWQTFLYLGVVFFVTAAFLSYHQGWYLSVIFAVMAIGCGVVVRKCF